MSNSWRALARMAKDQIVATPSSDTAMILDVSLSISNTSQALIQIRISSASVALVTASLLSCTHAPLQPSYCRMLQPICSARDRLSALFASPDCAIRTGRIACTNHVLGWRCKRVFGRAGEACEDVQEGKQSGRRFKRYSRKCMGGERSKDWDDGCDAAGRNAGRLTSWAAPLWQ
jgi:hypothetical protein